MNTLIRKYTPPTCTLEIWGKNSPLSVWAGKNLLSDARFELRLDDPRIAEERQVTLRGDRSQLQLLREIVDRYVQGLLAISPVDSPATPPLPSLPSLVPKDFLHHELSFGSLTADSDRGSIEITTSQLFDLANALEEYGSETEILPELLRKQGRKSALIWSVVAAGAVAAVGGTVIALRTYQGENVATLAPAPSPTITGQLPDLPLPPTGPAAPSPRVPTTLSGKTPLPPPPTAGGVVPPLRPSSVPLVVPPPPKLPPPPAAGPSPSGTASVIEPRNDSPTPAGPITAPPAPISDRSPAVEQVSPKTLNPTPAPPKLPKLPPIAPPTPEKSDENALAPAAPPRETAIAPETNLLDTIPQVAETREYFKARWKPPESLKQTLEYRLVMNPDGSLKQIIPLGRAAGVYLDRVGMPLLNEPFVSPLEVPGNPRVRLVLSPDGTVRTFWEQP
ncbi:DUF4335 domain-containing protein [Pannus brasiliensis CCIBt3594]|uniref:DUF4335 domain-containing protein n=1 Tax=Pannus brasiliensis CCIBt3594 TaxID=1427578 RepID=A0AAW9QLQ4_9CHRO